MLLLINHQLTEEQERDAFALDGMSPVAPPDGVKAAWASISPHETSLKNTLKPVFNWLEDNCPGHKHVLVQGEPGATMLVVQKVWNLGGKPCYATTERKAVEVRQADGSIDVKRTFRHVRFREYERL